MNARQRRTKRRALENRKPYGPAIERERRKRKRGARVRVRLKPGWNFLTLKDGENRFEANVRPVSGEGKLTIQFGRSRGTMIIYHPDGGHVMCEDGKEPVRVDVAPGVPHFDE